METQRLNSFATCLAVDIRIVAGYQRQTYHTVILPPCFRYQSEIVKHKTIALPGVIAVYVGVHILDVDNQGIDHWKQSLDVGGRHIERRLQVESPRRAAQFAKVADKPRTQTRFTPAESHASVCSYKIKFVNTRLGIQLLRRILAKLTAIAQRLRIKTITAPERTSMESHKRSHSLAVSRKAMSRYADYLCCLLLHASKIRNTANIMIIRDKSKPLFAIFLVEKSHYNFSNEDALSELLSERRDERNSVPKSADKPTDSTKVLNLHIIPYMILPLNIYKIDD